MTPGKIKYLRRGLGETHKERNARTGRIASAWWGVIRARARTMPGDKPSVLALFVLVACCVLFNAEAQGTGKPSNVTYY